MTRINTQYNPFGFKDVDFKLGVKYSWDKKVQSKRPPKKRYFSGPRRGENPMIYLKPITDLRLVKTIYSDPELFARISEDGVEIDDFDVDKNALYLAMMAHNTVIGIAQFEEINDVTLMAHCNVLHAYRQRYAEFVGYALIAWFSWDAPPNNQKLQVVIPECYPDVIGFVKKHGLQHEGTRRQSISKNGVLYNEWLGGITRSEAQAWLNQQHIKAVG